MNHKIYEVGGSVRDSLLNKINKDEDFVFVIENNEDLTIAEGFSYMRNHLLKEGFHIFLETPDCLTIRAKFPSPKNKVVGDFVLARKEIAYIGNTRTPIVRPGSLEDDLSRRDFTVNAIAKDDEGNYIDLFNGLKDLKNKVLRTPLDPMVTLSDDPLRAIRAVRFCITKDFDMHNSLKEAIFNPELPLLTKVVSTERIREELAKCFKYNTIDTLTLLNQLPTDLIVEWLGRDNLWLMPTTKK